MKANHDFPELEVLQSNVLPTPLNKDHNYYSVPVDSSCLAAAANCNYDYGDDVITGRNEKSNDIKDWKTLCGLRFLQRNPRSDVTADRNPRNGVISARIPSTDSTISRLTCSDVTEGGNLSYDDVKFSGKPLPDEREMDKSLGEMKGGKHAINASFVLGSRQKEISGDTLDIFSDSKDTDSAYSMLIDEEIIGSLLSQTKVAKEPSRSMSRMKLDSRYRTNSSDSAFSEDSLLEDDEDTKLETLISQFIFNPTNLQNDFTEYVESDHNAVADDVDVDGLDVTDLFSSVAMFGPDLGGPTSPGFATIERESGLGSSENSISSDHRDSSPVKRHTLPLFQKNDSTSSLSSSSSSSSSSAPSSSSSSSSSPFSSASLSLSSLSLDTLSSTISKSFLNVQQFEDPYLSSAPAGEKETLKQTGVCDSSSQVTQVRDSETYAFNPVVEGARFSSSSSTSSSSPHHPPPPSSSSVVVSNRGDNSDDQGNDSTGFITLPSAHLATTKTTTTINNTISHSNNNTNTNNNTTTNNDDDNKDNYDFLLNHLRNGFQPPFEIRGDNSELLLDEPDFVDFPFPTETQICRPNLPDTPTLPEKTMEPDENHATGSLVGFHCYNSDKVKAKQKRPPFLPEGPENAEKALDESFATAVLYLSKSPPEETPELTVRDIDSFNDYFEVVPKRDEIEDCFRAPATSQWTFPDLFSIGKNGIESDMPDSTSDPNSTEFGKPKEKKHFKNDDSEFVKVNADYTSMPNHPQTDITHNPDDVQNYPLNSGEIPKSLRLLCSVKKCTASKRPVQNLNLIKKVPFKKKSTFQSKTLPVSDEKNSKADCHVSHLNRTECYQSKSTHSPPRIEILSWDDTGSLHVKVPKLSVNNNESRISQKRSQCSLLREALTAEESHPRFSKSVKEGKHKNTKSKSYRNELVAFPNETLIGGQTVEIMASEGKSGASEMSELEKYLRGIIPTEADSKEQIGNQTSDQEDLVQASFLRKLLTGEMSTHAYREIDRRMCEKKRREIK